MIYEQIKKKISKFLSDLTGENWTPEQPREGPNSYVDDMIAYLNVIYLGLQNLSSHYVETCFRDSVKFTSKEYIGLLFDSGCVKNYNFYGISNLREDVVALEKYFNEIGKKGFNDCLFPIKNLIDKIFYEKNIEDFHKENQKIEKFYQVDEQKLVNFLSKYKNVKNKKEIKGKAVESDVQSMIKKLKNLIQ